MNFTLIIVLFIILYYLYQLHVKEHLLPLIFLFFKKKKTHQRTIKCDTNTNSNLDNDWNPVYDNTNTEKVTHYEKTITSKSKNRSVIDREEDLAIIECRKHRYKEWKKDNIWIKDNANKFRVKRATRYGMGENITHDYEYLTLEKALSNGQMGKNKDWKKYYYLTIQERDKLKFITRCNDKLIPHETLNSKLSSKNYFGGGTGWITRRSNTVKKYDNMIEEMILAEKECYCENEGKGKPTCLQDPKP
tara:strand:- start:353 stop:1093 length:741 start_codon:yes stop_codon:yes gene_type:complete